MFDYVSLIRNASVECFTYVDPNCKIMKAIWKKVVRMGEQNLVYRLSQAKDDKEAIAGWKRDLDKILQIFDVRPVGFP